MENKVQNGCTDLACIYLFHYRSCPGLTSQPSACFLQKVGRNEKLKAPNSDLLCTRLNTDMLSNPIQAIVSHSTR